MDVLYNLMNVRHTDNFIAFNNEYVHCHVLLAWDCVIFDLLERRKRLMELLLFFSRVRIKLNLSYGSLTGLKRIELKRLNIHKSIN